MATPLDIYKTRRVVPVEFKRATHGNPDASRPELDDRSFRAAEHGPIVGITEGSTVTVRLSRVMIDAGAKLVAKSSDTSVVTVVDPATGELPGSADMDIQLNGVSGDNPKKAAIEIHFDKDTGPLLHSLTCWVFKLRRVVVTPHLVTIGQAVAGPAPITSTANVNAILTSAKAIWASAGITLTINATVNDAVTFGLAGIVSDSPFPGELKTLLTQPSWVANTINVFFVPQIGTGGTLGYGFSRPSSVSFATGNPGIILGDATAGGAVHDAPWAANDVAHEIGHFLQLWHPNNLQPPNEREDTWCRRMLMHNYNTEVIQNNWKDDVGYGALGGSARRGALVTMKTLPHITTDGQCMIARGAILSGPY
jgi:hypothetical protein